MTAKQRKFADEYLIDCNATQAAIRAGYSKKSAKVIGAENLTKPYIKSYIEAKLEEISSQKIATAKEVKEYLTSVLRGESESEVVVVEGSGDGYSDAKRILKHPDEKEKLKAAELLGKAYGIYKEKLDVHTEPVVIKNDLKE